MITTPTGRNQPFDNAHAPRRSPTAAGCDHEAKASPGRDGTWAPSKPIPAAMQRLRVIVRREKRTVLHRIFSTVGMLTGTTSRTAGAGTAKKSGEECTRSEEEYEDGMVDQYQVTQQVRYLS